MRDSIHYRISPRLPNYALAPESHSGCSTFAAAGTEGCLIIVAIYSYFGEIKGDYTNSSWGLLEAEDSAGENIGEPSTGQTAKILRGWITRLVQLAQFRLGSPRWRGPKIAYDQPDGCCMQRYYRYPRLRHVSV